MYAARTAEKGASPLRAAAATDPAPCTPIRGAGRFCVRGARRESGG